MEQLKQELYKSIAELGATHPKTVEISQRLDVLVVKETRRINNLRG